jgi:hypothetical protein
MDQPTAAIRAAASASVVQVIEVPGELTRGNAEQLSKVCYSKAKTSSSKKKR